MDKFFQPMSKNKKRKELNLNESTFVVGHVGRFSKIKNHVVKNYFSKLFK
jgi:hypothetical protein